MKYMVPSPYVGRQKLTELAFHTRMMADLLKVHDTLLKSVDSHSATAEEVLKAAKAATEVSAEARSHMARIKELPPGQDGYTPVKGVDYFTSSEIQEITEAAAALVQPSAAGYTPILGKDYLTPQEIQAIKDELLDRIPTPEDGKDAVLDIGAITDEVVKAISKGKLLKIEHIDGLRPEVDSYRHQLAMKQAGQHGGGDTVAAGTNVTLTRTGDGKTVINATGGSSSAPLTPTGIVNAVNAVFGVVSRPSSVVSDGITYFEGFGYSYVALQITLDVSPSEYIKYYA